MFLIRNTALRFLIRHSSDFSKKPPGKAGESQPTTQEASPSSSVKNTQQSNIQKVDFESFPYKFGGIKNYGTTQSVIQLFFKNENNNFFQVYLALLESIANKNERKLAQLVQISLVRPLLQPQLMSTVVNANSFGQILLHDLSIGINAKFVRQKVSYNKQSTPDNIMHMYSPSNMFGMVSMMKGSENIPMLISINSTIKSKAKLALQGYQQNNVEEEAHSLTFQCQSELNMNGMMSIMQSLPTIRSNPDPSVMQKLLFNDKRPSWRIGNIDGYLKPRYQ